MASSLEEEMQNKTVNQLLKHQQSADQGLMIRSLIPEDPTGKTDCSIFVIFQDNK